MKKSFNFIKRIVIVFLVVVNLFCFCGCSWLFEYGWNWRGPYHHAAVITIPRKTVSVGEETYSIINEKLYRHTNGALEEITGYYNGSSLFVSDIVSNGQSLYVAAASKILSFKDGKYIFICDAKGVLSLAIDNEEDERIYYLRFTGDIDDELRYKYELCSYNVNTGIKEIIFDFFGGKSNWERTNGLIVPIGDRFLFIDQRVNLFWVDEVREENRISPLDSEPYHKDMFFEDETFFVLEETIAKLKTTEEGISFEYLDETYEHPIHANALRLYPIVKVIEDKIYFAVNDWGQKEDCEKPDCLCGYNKSMLITFDLESRQFSVKKEIGEMDAFIDFNKDESIYYSKGIIYRNESILEQVEEIQPGIPYRTVLPSSRPFYLYDLNISYYQGEIYWRLQDNRAYLKDEYA